MHVGAGSLPSITSCFCSRVHEMLARAIAFLHRAPMYLCTHLSFLRTCNTWHVTSELMALGSGDSHARMERRHVWFLAGGMATELGCQHELQLEGQLSKVLLELILSSIADRLAAACGTKALSMCPRNWATACPGGVKFCKISKIF